LRGILLRIAFRRSVAIIAGAALIVPAAVLWAGDYRWESWATDGIGLVLGATGAALMLAGMSGRRPDWIQ
jgi:hypothetical protein